MADPVVARPGDGTVLVGSTSFGHEATNRAAAEGKQRNIEVGATEFCRFHWNTFLSRKHSPRINADYALAIPTHLLDSFQALLGSENSATGGLLI